MPVDVDNRLGECLWRFLRELWMNLGDEGLREAAYRGG